MGIVYFPNTYLKRLTPDIAAREAVEVLKDVKREKDYHWTQGIGIVPLTGKILYNTLEKRGDLHGVFPTYYGYFQFPDSMKDEKHANSVFGYSAWACDEPGICYTTWATLYIFDMYFFSGEFRRDYGNYRSVVASEGDEDCLNRVINSLLKSDR